MNRTSIGKAYCNGVGIEVGPGHFPWDTPQKSLYVDRCTRAELLPQFPVESRDKIPETDIVADGFKLTVDMAGLVDYVVSSHVLEHTPRPAEALDNWASVIKPGGYIVGAVPNKDQSFDLPRPITSWDDLTTGDLTTFKLRQYREWFSLMDRLKGQTLEDTIVKAAAGDDHIHFAVWDYPTFEAFLNRYAAERGMTLVELSPSSHEIFFVLRTV